MLIRKNLFIVLSLAAIIVTSACAGRGTPDVSATLAPMYTAAAQTLQALTTQVAVTPNVPPTIIPTPTNTAIVPLPTLTQPAPPAPLPPAPLAATRCDWVGFVGDVSVPDGSSFAPSTAFTKTWRLKNIGTCTWTSAYQLVFYSDNAMGGPVSQPLTTGTVAPGHMVDISVNLTSPSVVGHYRGYWKLQNPTGVKFGLGAQANAPFYVDINVVTPTLTSTPTLTPTPTPTSSIPYPF